MSSRCVRESIRAINCCKPSVMKQLLDMKENPAPSNELIFQWALQLARTMVYFHEVHHIMHRDIRPEKFVSQFAHEQAIIVFSYLKMVR